MRKALEQILYLATVALNGTVKGYYDTNRADIARIADEALKDNRDHCLVCDKEIPPGPNFCSKECEDKATLKDIIAIACMTNIANGFDERGHFLSGFAKAFCRADLENQRILMPAVHQFIVKYHIEETQRTKGILNEAQYM